MVAENLSSALDFFKTKTPSLIGIDISSTSVKLVELSDAGKGTFRLERYAIEPLPKDVVMDGNIANMEQVTQQWFQEFRQEVTQAFQSRQVDALNKARAATQSLAKSQTYSLVFDSTVATYAANDVTADALKVMNAKK